MAVMASDLSASGGGTFICAYHQKHAKMLHFQSSLATRPTTNFGVPFYYSMKRLIESLVF